MEATFSVKREELTVEWLERLKEQFAGQSVITITATAHDKPLSAEEQRIVTQREMLRTMQALQIKYPPQTIDADVDINKLIDEMYLPGNH